MSWLWRYRVRHYVTSAIWIGPLLSMAAALSIDPRTASSLSPRTAPWRK